MPPLPLRFLLIRLAVVTAAGALLTAAAVTRAVGTDGAGDAPAPSATATPGTTTPTAGTSAPSPATPGDTTTRPTTTRPTTTQPTSDGPAGGSDNGPRFYRGVVTARGGLALHARPDRGSPVVRVARKGEVVWIHCKTPGQDVNGNPLWYLLADGAWSWGTARYIDNIGPAPRWC
ncbi:SH3 domain-containing protein [Streptomyces sp. MK7]|uniref:SH3 domain-containing protein n=1 Tax=Streptomyces sp. MK7 TaxID=3067635 RepID=UPI0029303011|nr:SH3 domain-containing protein [Streptomyces sp. MK7]